MFHKSNIKRENKAYPNASEKMKIVCLLCGYTYGNHNFERCPTKVIDGKGKQWEQE